MVLGMGAGRDRLSFEARSSPMLSPSGTRPGVLAIGGDTASLGTILLARMSGGEGAAAAEADERLLKLCQK
jgi:hypothetical protein